MELIYNNTYYIVGKNQLFEETEEFTHDSDVKLLKVKFQEASNSSTDIKAKETVKKFTDTLNAAIGGNGSDNNTERNNNFKEAIEKSIDICNNIENMKDIININGQDYKKVED